MELNKFRENKHIQIVTYEPKYREAFKSLNVEWISRYFEMEEADFKVLDNPEKDILENGGRIYVALYRNEPVGVCALKKLDPLGRVYEMVKMAVSPGVQGKGIGRLLGQTIIDAAKELGAKKLYLEGNTKLEASIKLYHKLGFQKVTDKPSPYKRVNIQMELILDK